MYLLRKDQNCLKIQPLHFRFFFQQINHLYWHLGCEKTINKYNQSLKTFFTFARNETAAWNCLY